MDSNNPPPEVPQRLIDWLRQTFQGTIPKDLPTLRDPQIMVDMSYAAGQASVAEILESFRLNAEAARVRDGEQG